MVSRQCKQVSIDSVQKIYSLRIKNTSFVPLHFITFTKEGYYSAAFSSSVQETHQN